MGSSGGSARPSASHLQNSSSALGLRVVSGSSTARRKKAMSEAAQRVTVSDDQTQEALAWAEHFNDYGECALDPRGAASVIHAQIVETERLTAERDRARDAA